MKLFLSLLVFLLLTEACWGGCVKANWWGSFDNQGWSTCLSSDYYMNAMYRSGGGNDIYHLEEAWCCPATGPGYGEPTTCMNANWWGVLDGQHVWALCPSGYFMQGLYRTGENDDLYNIEEARCCKPDNLPYSYLRCYDEDISLSFDYPGWAACHDESYYMTGFYKSDCESLVCIEKIRCCKMHGSEIPGK